MSYSNKKERNNKRGKDYMGIYGEIKRKMRPYVGEDDNKFGKFSYENRGESTPYKKTKQIKTEIKNANRAAKKSARQQAKQEINKKLNKEND